MALLVAVVVSTVIALAPGLLGYEGQPGNQSNGKKNQQGQQGYEGQPGNQGGG